ncbi:hypothetical protein QFC21_007317 [Naganishia friedmannii]|uniref:Uncharacterized protein n=1 Tax=Naganishia friedmannii TaxID=89922 RepID=A0ACC2UWX0_9TREE|nr:hypothetical protein QFC21_007317 [Naganishia friedmannii]
MDSMDAEKQEYLDIMAGRRPLYQQKTTYMCETCKEFLSAGQFNEHRGDRIKSCTICLKPRVKQERERRKNVKQASRKKHDHEASDDEEEVVVVMQPKKSLVPLAIGWPQLLKSISQSEGDTADVWLWRVSLGEDDIMGEVKDPDLLARAVAQEFWAVTKYRMVYKDKRSHEKRTEKSADERKPGVATYRFYCAENEKEQKAPKENPVKKRRRMNRFPCGSTGSPHTRARDGFNVSVGCGFSGKTSFSNHGKCNHFVEIGKTNSLGYELYGFVAEANGRGLPLLFMCIQTDSTALERSKTAMIARCLEYLTDKCPNIKFALSDKDQSEINAVKQVMGPRGVKHQLCYWHVMRHLADRLADNTKPRPYYPSDAFGIFDFIDPTWGPPLPKKKAHRPAADAAVPVEDVIEVTLESAYSARLPKKNTAKLSEFCPHEHRGVIEDIHGNNSQ